MKIVNEHLRRDKWSCLVSLVVTVRCEVPDTGRLFYELDTVQLDNPADLPRAADVVFVIQHAACNVDLMSKISALIDGLDNAMSAQGLTSLRYAVVGFGGTQHLTEAHVHTMDGQVFNSASKVSIFHVALSYCLLMNYKFYNPTVDCVSSGYGHVFSTELSVPYRPRPHNCHICDSSLTLTFALLIAVLIRLERSQTCHFHEPVCTCSSSSCCCIGLHSIASTSAACSQDHIDVTRDSDSSVVHVCRPFVQLSSCYLVHILSLQSI